MAVEFGKYQLLQKIGSGGMGQIFLARTVGTQDFEKLVVIKRLLPHLSEDEEFLSMFLDEARIAARFNHPNLIQIFELGDFADAHYLAMEYVAGENLRELDRYLRGVAKQTLPLGMACRIVADAAAGLAYAHNARDAQGRPLSLVHRDVSPQNILVGFDGAVKLIDFGVAKAAGKAQSTATGVLRGKYSYMSPEQADGGPLDARSDVFSLGVVFWELLTGKRLFKGDSELTTLRLVTACQVPLPSKMSSSLPLADGLVMKALAKDPDQRYPDAAAFRLALEDFILEQRLQASSAHLATFMHGLYKDRIAALEDPAALDQLHSLGELEPGAPPPSGSHKTEVLEPTGEPSVSRSRPTTPARLHPRGRSGSHPRVEAPPTDTPRRSGAHPAVSDTPRRSGAHAAIGEDSPRRSGTHPRADVTPSRGLAGLSAGEGGAQAGHEAPREVTQVVASRPVSRETKAGRIFLFAMMGLGACLALVAFWLLNARAESAPGASGGSGTPPPPVISAQTTPPLGVTPVSELAPQPLVPRPPPVKLQLRSQPLGARVRVGDKDVGVTPVDYALDPDAPPGKAIFSLPGYESLSVPLSAKSAPVVSVSLTKKRLRPPPPTIKTGR